MARYKMIAADIDGTLLDSRSELRPAVRLAIRRAVEAGVEFILCTGRRYRTALLVAQEAGLPLPIVCHSGALVKETSRHRTLHARPIEGATFELLLDALAELPLTPLVYVDAFESGIDFFIENDAPLTRYHEDYLGKNEGFYRVVRSVRRDLPGSPIQVCTFAQLDELREFRARLQQHLGGGVTCHLLHSPKYLGHFLEFQDGSACKWGAIASLARSRGIAPEEIVAIGDDENDISMLRAAGLGVAMGNAARAVKSAADIVTTSNDEDGAARIVEKVLREG